VAVSITIAGNHIFHGIGRLVRNFAYAILDPLRAGSDVILCALARASGVLASFVELVTRIAGAIGRGCLGHRYLLVEEQTVRGSTPQRSRLKHRHIGEPAAQSSLWADVDRRLVDQAYWVPTVSVRDVFLTSKRLRNVQYSPIGDFIADQVWLR
jgi:hypothetical protein